MKKAFLLLIVVGLLISLWIGSGFFFEEEEMKDSVGLGIERQEKNSRELEDLRDKGLSPVYLLKGDEEVGRYDWVEDCERWKKRGMGDSCVLERDRN